MGQYKRGISFPVSRAKGLLETADKAFWDCFLDGFFMGAGRGLWTGGGGTQVFVV